MLQIYSILLIGVIITSTSSLLIRWAGDVSFIALAFYRLFISTLLLIIYHIITPRKNKLSFHFVHWHYSLAGFFLAGHFITWIASLQMTTIAHSIFLQSIHPIFAVLFSMIFLKEFPSIKSIPAFILAIFGVFLIVYGDFGAADTHFIGDLLAISAACLLALYLLIARYHKNEPDFIKYLIIVYGTAALLCAIFMIFAGNNFLDYSSRAWLMIVLLALGPSLLGHSLLNWSSRFIEIFKVNLTLQLEPVLATLAGMIFFFEYPSRSFYSGAALIVFSILYLFYGERKISVNESIE